MMYISSLIPVILSISSITTTEGSGLEYVSHARSFEGARTYCQSVYGTDLASIVNAEDRNNAISAIGTASDKQAWLGLYTEAREGYWEFTNGDECPSNSVFRCVSFWRNRKNSYTRTRHRTIGRVRRGQKCAYFDASDNTVDNNVDCELTKPFFCQAPEALPSYNPGNYVFISGGEFGNGLNFDEAQGKCKSDYGTDLATIVTEADAAAAGKVITDNLDNSWPFAIIGLRDVDVEGDFQWIDGTKCTTTDGQCTDLFDAEGHILQENGPNNIGDIDSIQDADCIAFNPFNDASLNADGSNFIEMGCDNPEGIEWNILCNAPLIQSTSSYNPGNYVFISGGTFNDGLNYNFDSAQAKCESEYGTDLATIVTEADAVAAGKVITDNLDNDWPFTIIGLNDINTEGQYAWKDGTECTVNDNGRCIADLFDPGYYEVDDVDDISTVSGADCILFEPSDNGALLDGSNFFEMECANSPGNQHNVLCNAPVLL